MRSITLIGLLILSINCTTINKVTVQQWTLNGSWIPVKQEMGGASLPAQAFENQLLIINDSTYTYTAESVDKGSLTYANNKMDIYPKEGVNAGKHFTAIYKYENELLTICYNLQGDNYPQTFETKSKQFLFLSVYKKEMIK